ncbi:MAG: electron transfer flavoprotein subunit beta/FixA family protein [Candidatus Nanopelagicales bacterium]
MRIVVCVKQVPDSWAEKKLSATDHTLDRESVDAVINELDEYAIEEALLLAAAHSGEVIVVSMGPAQAADSVRKALQMGADSGVHIVDDALHGSDSLATSLVLASAIKAQQADLVIFGSESTDARMSVVPAMVAERLGLPQLTFASQVTVEGQTVRIQRVTEYGYDVAEAGLPAVVSVVEKINEPRYPSFKGIMAAKKKKVQELALADLGLTPAQVGSAAAYTEVVSATERPPKSKGVIITDDGNAGTEIAEFLAAQKLI